jgi:hypothetical protein
MNEHSSHAESARFARRFIFDFHRGRCGNRRSLRSRFACQNATIYSSLSSLFTLYLSPAENIDQHMMATELLFHSA